MHIGEVGCGLPTISMLSLNVTVSSTRLGRDKRWKREYNNESRWLRECNDESCWLRECNDESRWLRECNYELRW